MTPDGRSCCATQLRVEASTEEDRLNGQELGLRIEPTFEDEGRIIAVTRDDVLPHTRQPFRGIRSEEVAEGGLAEPVEMFMRSKKRWRRVKTHAGLFTNLADRRLDQPLISLDTASRNLGSRIRVVVMVEDEQPVLPFDVDNNSLPERHLMIVGRRRLRQRWGMSPHEGGR